MKPHFISEEQFSEMQNRVRGKHGIPQDGRRGHGIRVTNHSVGDPAKPSSISKAPSPFAPYQLSMTGQVPSGKNQVQLLWRNGKVHRYPNKTFTNWRAKASMELLEQARPAVPLSAPIRLTCDYWPGNRIVRDVSGQLDAIFSLLVHVKILKNDGLVYDVIWRRHEVNKKFPKAVMEIEAY